MVANDAIALYYRVISLRLRTIIVPRDAVILDTSSPVLLREENTSKFHKTWIYPLEIIFQSIEDLSLQSARTMLWSKIPGIEVIDLASEGLLQIL